MLPMQSMTGCHLENGWCVYQPPATASLALQCLHQELLSYLVLEMYVSMYVNVSIAVARGLAF